MKKFLPYVLNLFMIIISIGISAAEQKKVFEVDSNRDLTRTESIAPGFYQNHGPYLFFTSEPSEVADYVKILSAYGASSLWRLDTRDNSILLVSDNINTGQNNSYAIANERIIFFSREGLISVNLSGSDKKLLGISSLKFGLWKHLETSLSRMRASQMVSYNGYVYFPVVGDVVGARQEGPTLWRTNGTAEGTSKVDLCLEGLCYNSAQQLIVSGNKLFFLATRNNSHEHRVWSVDSSNEVSVIPSTGTAYTKIFRSLHGIQFNTVNQLWFSDGTSEGTYSIAQEMAGESIGFGDTIVMSTASNISFIKDKGKGTATTINLGFDTVHTNLIELNDAIYFVSRKRLVRVDSTDDETQEIFSFGGSNEVSFKVIKGKGNKFFVLRNDIVPNKPPINEIWVSDGTTEGTSKLTEYGIPKKFWYYDAWLLLNNDLYFSGFTNEHGLELWRTDSSPQGTFLAKDIGYGQTKVQAGPIASSGQYFYYSMQKRWYGLVGGIEGEHSEQELWKTDASTMVSSKVTQWKYPDKRLAQIVPVDGGQFWWRESDNSSDYYYHLDFYDEQSEEVTTVITDMLGRCGNHNFTILKMETLGNKYFFQAPVVKDDTWSCQLWVSDGTVEGTMSLTNLPNTSSQPEKINNIVSFQNEVYFSLTVNADEHIPLRTTIFKTDGTISGTKEVFQLSASGEDPNAYIANMSATSQGLFIVTNFLKNNDGLFNLWYWQPTGIKKVIENAYNFQLSSIVRFKQGISFINAYDIWRSDGTEEGTYSMIELPLPQYQSHYPTLYSTPNFEKIIYTAPDDTKTFSLWSSDGTTFGTKVIEPKISNGNFNIDAFVEDNIYVTYWTDMENNNLDEHLIRYSLIGNETELLRKRRVSTIYDSPKIIKAQGRAFIGQSRGGYFGSVLGFGGPFVTSTLDNDDIDNDGVMNVEDAFPLHSEEQLDTDGDDIGDNLDTDDDNDMFADELDLFPLNATEWADADKDGVGDIEDTDDDNDGVTDWLDSYPRDSSRSHNVVADNSLEVDDTAKDSTISEKSSGGVIHFYIVLYILVIVILRRRVSC
jgi:ELWxxDGT repeat protein